MAVEITDLKSDGEGNKLEIFLALALGIAAIGTAYAAFRSSLLNDDMISNYQLGIRNVNESTQATDEANLHFAQDQAVFLEFMKAAQTNQDGLTAYIQTELMSKPLSDAVDVWAKTDLVTPFEDEEIYYLDGWRRGDELTAQADRRFAAAATADEESDRYELVTVIMAAVLFFLGMGAIVKKGFAKSGFIMAGSVLLTVSLVMLVMLTV